MIALSGILKKYRARLRVPAVLVQEALAVLGLAVGVALLFAAQIAGTSLNHSVTQLTRGLVGEMQLQLQARGPDGFPAQLLGEVRRIPGVLEAQPVVEEQANVIGPRGAKSVELLGVPSSFARRLGHLAELPGHPSVEQLSHQQELGLPAPVAEAIGAGTEALSPIEIAVGTRVTSTLVGEILGQENIGALVASPVVLAPVSYAAELSGAPGRVSRIFVKVAPGREAQVRAALLALALAAGRLGAAGGRAGGIPSVEPAEFDATLFAHASAPTNQSAGLFAAISALVGFLFAFNAMLITTASRREVIAELREDGATRRRIVQTLLFDALVLGSVGCVLGLALGDLASIALFGSNPGYLSFAFPVGSQRVVTSRSVAIAVVAGMLAAAVGVLVPLRSELSRPLQSEEARRARGAEWGRGAAMVAEHGCRGIGVPGADDGGPRVRPRGRDPRDREPDRRAAAALGAAAGPLDRSLRSRAASAALGRHPPGLDRAA